jgi:hypothetical protein
MLQRNMTTECMHSNGGRNSDVQRIPRSLWNFRQSVTSSGNTIREANVFIPYYECVMAILPMS